MDAKALLAQKFETDIIGAGALDELDVLIRIEVEVEFSPDAIYETSELFYFVHIWRLCSLAGALAIT